MMGLLFLINKRLTSLLRHIAHVRENCETMGEALIEQGEAELGLQLIANGQTHDQSKFHGIEWECLADPDDRSDPRFVEAITQHVRGNSHHPEFWGSIHEMSRVALAEMVADWTARSAEQGTSVIAWIEERGMPRFSFGTADAVYSEIRFFLTLLLERPFGK